MKKIPCRKCSCGIYHDLTVTTCRCGKDISTEKIELVDVDELSKEEYGEINRDLVVYVQKCYRCGTYNFTTNPLKPKIRCSGCYKSIERSKPVALVDDEKTKNSETEEKIKDSAENTTMPDDDEDKEIVDWEKLCSGANSVLKKKEELDDQMEDTLQTPVSESSLTLTAIRFGSYSFTVSAEQDSPYMLGRSAGQGEFLSKDMRVSNMHCLLCYRDGRWFVKDNGSSNGTAVNSRDIGEKQESPLNSGDELKLGHHPDSMAFRVIIS